MTGGNLRSLLAQATPGPWGAFPALGSHVLRADNEHYTRLARFDEQDQLSDVEGSSNTRLAALAPDAVSLLIDCVAYIDGLAAGTYEEYASLLERFRQLDRKAGGE